MTKKEIAQQIKHKIREGKSQQEVFDEISALSYRNEEELANIVKYYPSIRLRKRNHKGNTILLILLALVVLVETFSVIFASFALGGASFTAILTGLLRPALLFLLMVLCSKYTARAHLYLSFINSFMVFKLFIHLITNRIDTGFLILAVIYVMVMIASIYMHKRLVLGYTRLKERYLNNEGQERMRYVYEFYDQPECHSETTATF